MLTALRRFGLYFHTIRWLRVSQLAWQIYRRIRPVSIPAPVPVEPRRTDLLRRPYARAPQPSNYEFCFLNESRPADPELIDWHPQDVSRLWRYNLHYFDYLLWDAFPADHKNAYIDSWIEANPVGVIDAWEPYTQSLRIVNWIKYFDTLDQEIPQHWATSLINQAVWLESNLEHHILANHLFKNAKALVFAGCMFSGPVGKRLLRIGTRLIIREIDEQILADGGHYERSPMYHCLILEDLIDLCNLLGQHTELINRSDYEHMRESTVRALTFLATILGADGKIPLFNDSAFEIAPEPYELLNYGELVLGKSFKKLSTAPARIELLQSGYYGYRTAQDSFIIDCGPVGPNYQPGHAHCDTLSFTLCIDGQPFVVDAGVRGYENDDLREYVRSTAAHNTVQIDNAEQSEIWGTFRVARRAVAKLIKFSEVTPGKIRFVGMHDGYKRLSQSVVHTREVSLDLEGVWEIVDQIAGRDSVHATAYMHFHPEITLAKQSDLSWLASRGDHAIARVTIAEDCSVEERTGFYCPEFGLSMNTATLAIQRAARPPFSLSYKIEKVPCA